MESYFLPWAIVSMIFSVVGFSLLIFYTKQTKNFLWREYLGILFIPFVPVMTLSAFEGYKVWLLWLAYSLCGTCFEYLLGFFYEKIIGRKLWVYQKYSVNGYTSLLSIPLWGFGGFIFWFLARIIGI